jgi:hypothetical protein
MKVFLFEQYGNGLTLNYQPGMPEQIMVQTTYAHTANNVAKELCVDFERYTWSPVEQGDQYETATDVMIENGEIPGKYMPNDAFETMMGLQIPSGECVPLAWIALNR